MITLESLQSDLIQAMKAKNTIALETLRSLKTRLSNSAIAQQRQLTEAEIIQHVQAEVKRRAEAAALFRQGNNETAAAHEEAQAQVLQAYLPQQLSDSALTEQLQSLQKEHNWSQKDFGVAMKTAKEACGDTADNSRIAQILKSIIS